MDQFLLSVLSIGYAILEKLLGEGDKEGDKDNLGYLDFCSGKIEGKVWLIKVLIKVCNIAHFNAVK